MGYQIVFAWSEESAVELESMGFKKQEVYMKNAPGGITEEEKEKGDAEFFHMESKPFQFATTSYWGVGFD